MVPAVQNDQTDVRQDGEKVSDVMTRLISHNHEHIAVPSRGSGTEKARCQPTTGGIICVSAEVFEVNEKTGHY